MNPTIFVQIASYRDPELPDTVQDAIAKATKPDRLSFGICFQGSDQEWERDAIRLQGIPRLALIRWHYNESQGACWARSITQRLWAGEDYSYQIDSHSRFEPGWDELLIEMIQQCPSDRPILSSFPASYNRRTGELQQNPPACRIGTHRFDRYSILTLQACTEIKSDRPVPGFLISAGQLFTIGRWNMDVPYDPLIYFNGEESTLAIRSWTHGYDIFHPQRQVLYHNYARDGAPRHWSDNLKVDRELNAYARCRQLLGMEQSAQGFGKYGLGTARNLQAYQQYSGINFASKTISESGVKGIPTPDYTAMSQSAQAQSKLAIAVATFATPDLDYFWKYIAHNNAAYAKRHGYGWITWKEAKGEPRHPTWQKIQMAMELLEQYDYVWTIDADLSIMDRAFRLENIIAEHSSFDIIASSDASNSGVRDQPNLNGGSLLYKNTPWTKAFLKRVWQEGDDFADKYFYEQSVMNHMIQNDLNLLNHIKILPEKALNSCFPHTSYQSGDFVLHLMAISNQERLELVQKYLPVSLAA